MKTGLILGTIIALAIGLWIQIGWMTLVVLPVALILGAAAFTPTLAEAEPKRTETEPAPSLQPSVASTY